jgi:hypothetical protein
MQKIAWEISWDSMGAEHAARTMNTSSKDGRLGIDSPRPTTAEQRLRQLGIKLPTPPEPFDIYAEEVQAGHLLFLTGMLPTVGREAKFIGHIGGELDVQTGRQAAYHAHPTVSPAPRCAGYELRRNHSLPTAPHNFWPT